MPLATSSVTATGVPVSGGTTLPVRNPTEVTGPLYTTDDDGFTTDVAYEEEEKYMKPSGKKPWT